jgi:peptide chain release factor 2
MEKKTRELLDDITAAMRRLDVEEKEKKVRTLEAELGATDAWSDPEAAAARAKRLSEIKAEIEPWKELESNVADLVELSGDETLADEIEKDYATAVASFSGLKKQLLFRGPYDKNNAILRLTAGAGGDDAQDWTAMLERMYLRWAERHGFKAEIIERSASETAGVKTSVVKITTPHAYGKLKSENGVHRLVRLSPFNAESRETSFARVEVLPEIAESGAIEIDPKDLKIDIYHASGHGGQGVNTTDSAVRVTHLPTGLVVAIQNERSQIKNKAEALSILRGKLAALKEEQRAAKLSEIKGESQSAAWGQQIRNYVLHPYKLVKDTRTGYESKNPGQVLGGDIDGFIEAWLEKFSADAAEK